jgi:hypothetical protein
MDRYSALRADWKKKNIYGSASELSRKSFKTWIVITTVKNETKWSASLLAVSNCDVIASPTEEMPGTEVQLHLPDMRRTLFHTTSERVYREIF